MVHGKRKETSMPNPVTVHIPVNCNQLLCLPVIVQVGLHIYCADRKKEYNRNRIGQFYMRSIAQFCNSLASRLNCYVYRVGIVTIH